MFSYGTTPFRVSFIFAKATIKRAAVIAALLLLFNETAVEKRGNVWYYKNIINNYFSVKYVKGVINGERKQTQRIV